VIAILAAIIFPVFAKARERAYTADCTSNVHQLGMAFGMYLSDWGNRFPSGGNYYNGAERGSDWVHINVGGVAGDMSVEKGSLFPFVKDAGAYVCKNAIVAADPAQSGGTRTSYTMNSNLVNNTTWIGVKANKIKFPASTFLVVEENDATLGGASGQYNDALFYAPVNPAAGHDFPPGQNPDEERHGAGALACFIDGHAKWYPAVDLAPYSTGNQPTKLRPWYYPFRTKADVYP
jgi:hypothetical protein